MEKRFVCRTFVYFLCISFLLLTNGFHMMIAQGREIDRPIGEMFSKGEVKFESRENVWKKVESSNFPVFQGVKIKTQKSVAAIALENNSQMDVGENSLFSFDQNEWLHLYQGQINFRISPTAELNFKVGNLIITKSRPLQASKGPIAAPKNEETIGSISIHSNGSATIRSVQGHLSILGQDRTVLASLSPRDSVTIPSITVKSPAKVMVAQAGETAKIEEDSKVLGIPTWGWVGILGVNAITGIVIGVSAGRGGDSDFLPICF
jgi:hypothetical protein